MSPNDPTPMSRGAKALGVLIALRAALRTARTGSTPPPPSPESEIDPSQREVPSNPRAETLVALLLALAAVFAFAFTVIYIVVSDDTQLLGIAMGGALCLLAAACIVAGKSVVPQETHVEERDALLVEEQNEEVVTIIEEGGQGISRRALLVGAGGVAGAGLLTAAVTPIASLGPTVNPLHRTPWVRGVRLIDDTGKPYAADDIHEGAFYTALPEHGDPESFGSGVLVVRLPAEFLHLPADRRSWAPEGILAYSKICPHAGCAISLYRYPTYEPTSQVPAFTCPCHYSTFLPGEGGRVTFGPAGRALPQLPLMIDAERNLRAAGAFPGDIGPSWWGVRREHA